MNAEGPVSGMAEHFLQKILAKGVSEKTLGKMKANKLTTREINRAFAMARQKVDDDSSWVDHPQSLDAMEPTGWGLQGQVERVTQAWP